MLDYMKKNDGSVVLTWNGEELTVGFEPDLAMQLETYHDIDAGVVVGNLILSVLEQDARITVNDQIRAKIKEMMEDLW